MCGRYRLSRRKQIIEEHFDSISGEEDWVRRYNNAPTQPVPITGQNPKEPVRRLSLVRWGLIPSWAKDLSGPAMMINARSGTAATKPVFRDALKSRRFLVLADGFYEWRRTGKTKQPFCFEVNDGSLFAFAGLWDRWKDPNGTWVKSCSILTKSRTLNSESPAGLPKKKKIANLPSGAVGVHRWKDRVTIRICFQFMNLRELQDSLIV